MSQNNTLRNFFIKLIFSFLIIGIGLREVLDSKKMIKASQDNIYKARNLFHSFNIQSLTVIYNIGARFVIFMSYSLIVAGILLLLNAQGYMIFAHFSFILHFLLVNNVFLSESSRCFLTASLYLSLYGAFYYFK